MKTNKSSKRNASISIAWVIGMTFVFGQAVTGYCAEMAQNPTTGQQVPVVSIDTDSDFDIPAEAQQDGEADIISEVSESAPFTISTLQDALEALRTKIIADGANPDETIQIRSFDGYEYHTVSAVWRDSQQGLEHRASFIHVYTSQKVFEQDGFVDPNSFYISRSRPGILLFTTELRGNHTLVELDITNGEKTSRSLPTDGGQFKIHSVSSDYRYVYLISPNSDRNGLAYVYVKRDSVFKPMAVTLPKRENGSYIQDADFSVVDGKIALRLVTKNETYLIYQKGQKWNRIVQVRPAEKKEPVSTPELVKEQNILERKIDAAAKVIENKQEKVDLLQNQVAEKQSQIQKIRQRPGALTTTEKKRIESIEQQINSIRETIKNLRADITEQKKLIREYESRAVQIRNQLTSRRASSLRVNQSVGGRGGVHII